MADMGDGGTDPDMWLRECAYGHDDDAISAFINDTDTDLAPVRLMLLVERMLRLLPTHDDAMDPSDMHCRNIIAGTAARMGAKRKIGGYGLNIVDTVGAWLLNPAMAAGVVEDPETSRFDIEELMRWVPKAKEWMEDVSPRMLDLLAFAVCNREWSALLHDTLVSFIRHAQAHENMGDDTIPVRCGAILAAMIASAFNRGHDRTGMVSPLSVTMSMITGRVMDADTAAALPMVADGLYGHGRNPMDDLGALLDYAGDHGVDDMNDKALTMTAKPRMLSIFLPSGNHTGGVAMTGGGSGLDSAKMFAAITSPAFPGDVSAAVNDADRVFGSIGEPLDEWISETRSPKKWSVHFPLISYSMAARLADMPQRAILILGCAPSIRMGFQCDGKPGEDGSHTFKEGTGSAHMSEDHRRCAAWEDMTQKRGMLLFSRINATDWRKPDEGMMESLLETMFPIRGTDRSPMEYLHAKPEGDMLLQSENFMDALAAALESGQTVMASALNMLGVIMRIIDDTLAERQSSDSQGWVLSIQGSRLRPMIRMASDAGGLPDDFTVQTLLSLMDYEPLADHPRRRRFGHGSRRQIVFKHRMSDSRSQHYWILIDWDR